jgi:hypothetical protein
VTDPYDVTEYGHPPPDDADAPFAQVVSMNGHEAEPVEPFPTYGIDDLASLPTVEWVVDRIIQRGEGTLLYGERGAGKSLVALDMLLHIAAGIPWRGRPTQRQRVLLVVLENAYAMPERIWEWQTHHPDADLRGWFRFTVAPMRAIHDHDTARLHATIDEFQPGVVTIDTWQRFGAGLDELSGKDQQRVIDVLDEIRRRHDCTVVMVDHAGKDLRRGTRGHSSKEASFTVVAEVTQSEGLVKLATTKVNNAATSFETWDLVEGDQAPYLEPRDAAEAIAAQRAELVQRVVDHVKAHPGEYRTPITEQVRGKNQLLAEALDEAVQQGRLTETREGTRRRYEAVPTLFE